jgi:hypothetical protein
MTKKKIAKASRLKAEPCVIHPDGTVSDRELWADFLVEDARPHPWDTTCAEQAARHTASSLPTVPQPPKPRTNR